MPLSAPGKTGAELLMVVLLRVSLKDEGDEQ